MIKIRTSKDQVETKDQVEPKTEAPKETLSQKLERIKKEREEKSKEKVHGPDPKSQNKLSPFKKSPEKSSSIESPKKEEEKEKEKPSFLKKKTAKESTSKKSSALQEKLERIKREREEKKRLEEEKKIEGEKKEKSSILSAISKSKKEVEGINEISTQVRKVDEKLEKLNLEKLNLETGVKLSGKISTPEDAINALKALEEKNSYNKTKGEITYEDLNEDQKLAVDLGTAGKSFVIEGPAGSGKTATQRILLQTLLASGKVKDLTSSSKWLKAGNPAVLITAFTRVATSNIREAAPEKFKNNCINIHKAIEFAPTREIQDVWNEDFGDYIEQEVMRFRPQRNELYKLPDIQVCIIEESGTLDTRLFLELVAALPSDCIYIFLGDLNQVPPVHGAAILGFAACELPIVSLTKVYRTGAGPIKNLAFEILDGKPIHNDRLLELQDSSTPDSSLELVPMTKPHDGKKLNMAIGDYMKKEVLAGRYKVGKSIFLSHLRTPNENKLNIAEINKHIAQAVQSMSKQTVYNLRAKGVGGGSYFFAKGDVVFYEKQYYMVADIVENQSYIGMYGYDFLPPSVTLTRWGYDPNVPKHDLSLDDEISDEEFLEQEVGEENKNFLSHSLTLVPFEEEVYNKFISGEVTELVDLDDLLMESLGTIASIKITSPGDIAKVDFAYAQTIYAAQGSEWEDVYLAAPQQIMRYLNRELLYTAVTRARKRLVCFYENGREGYNIRKGTFQTCIIRQAIPGNDLAAKQKYFRNTVYKKAQYKPIVALLDELRTDGTITIERYKESEDSI